MRIFDNIFDPTWIHDTTNLLKHKVAWNPNNIANRSSYPNGEIGSHLMLGCVLFNRLDDDMIEYTLPLEDTRRFIGAWYAIMRRAERNGLLVNIGGNLQFKGMDGTKHIDGWPWNYVLMLGMDNKDLKGGEFINETTGEVVEYKSGRVIEIDKGEEHRANAFDNPNVPRYTLRLSGNEYRTNSN